jgi:ribosomal protein L12E/L44/L45/RPP1/RPP2
LNSSKNFSAFELGFIILESLSTSLSNSIIVSKSEFRLWFCEVGAKVDDEKILFLLNELEGKDILEVITSKKEKYLQVAMMVLAQ